MLSALFIYTYLKETYLIRMDSNGSNCIVFKLSSGNSHSLSGLMIGTLTISYPSSNLSVFFQSGHI